MTAAQECMERTIVAAKKAPEGLSTRPPVRQGRPRSTEAEARKAVAAALGAGGR